MPETLVPTLLLNLCMVEDKTAGKVLVLDKVDEGDGWGGLTFPGGHVEPAESLVGSAVREVAEETGLAVKNLKSCGVVDWFNTKTCERWLMFLYKTSHFSGRLVSQTGEGRVFWMDTQKLFTTPLAPNMAAYLDLFFKDETNEAFTTWNDTHFDKFTIF